MRNKTLIVAASALLFNVSVSAQSLNSYADSTQQAPDNWFNLDPASNAVQGISTEKTYHLLKGKKSQKVLVAVIDSGIDTDHEDLEGKIWNNEDEIPGNGKDDDNNGYVDDVHGWNFIGGKDGTHVDHDTYELTREYVRLTNKYEGQDLEKLPKKERTYFEEIKAKFEKQRDDFEQQHAGFMYFFKGYQRSSKLLEAYLDVEEVTAGDLETIDSQDEVVMTAKALMEFAQQNNYTAETFQEGLEYFENGMEYGYNTEFDPRTIVGDNYEDTNERFYGNNDVKGPDPRHGTHVAGIIAANRENNLGVKGIADNVEIMVLRAVPDGDERDKDVANAIYYAVDNGAKIINMSFGKSYSPQKEAVDKAVRYAEEKGVLLVHAAGNSSEDIDEEDNFPTRDFLDSRKHASNWIEVGATSWKNNEEIVAEFSNYGKKSVDVFAPGVDLYSTTPNSTYESLSGTSMAAPVTTGIAALLMAYYPDLTAKQVKDIILESAVKHDDIKVNCPGKKGKLVSFNNLSTTGAIVNALEAVKLAESYQIKHKD